MSLALRVFPRPCHRPHPSQDLPPLFEISSCQLPLAVSCGNAPLPQFVSCLFCFLLFCSLFFPSSDPSIRCLLQSRPTFGGVLRLPPPFFLFLLLFSNFALKWVFPFSSMCLLCWINSFPSSIPPPYSEVLLTMKFTVLILWLIFCHSGQVLALLHFCHLD